MLINHRLKINNLVIFKIIQGFKKNNIIRKTETTFLVALYFNMSLLQCNNTFYY